MRDNPLGCRPTARPPRRSRVPASPRAGGRERGAYNRKGHSCVPARGASGVQEWPHSPRKRGVGFVHGTKPRSLKTSPEPLPPLPTTPGRRRSPNRRAARHERTTDPAWSRYRDVAPLYSGIAHAQFMDVAGQGETNLLLSELRPHPPAPPGQGGWALRFFPSTGRGLPSPRHQIEAGKTRPRFRRCVAPGTTRKRANEALTALPVPRPDVPGSYLRATPGLPRFNHPVDQCYRAPVNHTGRRQSFPG
jgi:hypothetical protein